MRRFAFIVCLLAAGCAATHENAEITYVTITPAVSDVPSRGLLQLTYVNDTGATLCFSASDWPTSGGIIDNNGEEIFLTVEGQRYFLEEESDYCPRCTFEVRAGERLSDPLMYASFSLPPSEWGKPKELTFSSTVWMCPNGPGYD